MPRVRLFLPILFCLFLLAATAAAETRYVSDQLIIALRNAPDPDAAVITTLKSDTPVQILEDSGRFLKVRTDKGEEGYVLSQYVTPTRPKSLELDRLQQENQQLQNKLSQLQKAQSASSSELEQARQQQEAQIKDLQAKLAAAETELTSTKHQAAELQSKYETLQKDAANVVAVAKERDTLQAENTKLNAELSSLRDENNSLLRSGMIQWFLAGGGVFFFGWLVGKISRKKRRSF